MLGTHKYHIAEGCQDPFHLTVRLNDVSVYIIKLKLLPLGWLAPAEAPCILEHGRSSYRPGPLFTFSRSIVAPPLGVDRRLAVAERQPLATDGQ